MNGAMRRLGVHSLPQETHVLHFLADQSTGNADFLAPDDHDFLTIEKLFGDNGRESSQHVMPGVNDDALSTDTGTGDHVVGFWIDIG